MLHVNCVSLVIKDVPLQREVMNEANFSFSKGFRRFTFVVQYLLFFLLHLGNQSKIPESLYIIDSLENNDYLKYKIIYQSKNICNQYV